MNIRDGVSMYLYDIQLTEGDKAPTGYITAEEDVQAQIEQVKMDVDYIASDSSLTPSDKQQVANEWVRIQGEYWSIMRMPKSMMYPRIHLRSISSGSKIISHPCWPI